MDFNELITQVSLNLTPANIILMVLLVVDEIVANVPAIKSNSIGQLILSAIKQLLLAFWTKTNPMR